MKNLNYIIASVAIGGGLGAYIAVYLADKLEYTPALQWMGYGLLYGAILGLVFSLADSLIVSSKPTSRPFTKTFKLKSKRELDHASTENNQLRNAS